MKSTIEIKAGRRGDVQAQVINSEATVGIISLGIRDDATITEARKVEQSLLRFTHRTSPLHIAVLAASLFPSEETQLGALTRLRAMFDGWLRDTQTVHQLGLVERNERLALKNQHNLGVALYQTELDKNQASLDKRIAKWVETKGLSECGTNLDDLVQKGHTRESLLKIYPPQISLEELQANRDRLEAVQKQIKAFNANDIPCPDFIASMPDQFRNVRPTGWPASREVRVEA